MYNMYGIPEASTELGWAIGLPLLLMVLLFAMAVPVWVSLGVAAIALLMATEVLPLTLFGEALFSGIDAFALIAIPLFILTGDVLVRSGLSNKLLDVAEATMGSLRTGLGTSTVLGCGFFACISGSDAAGAAAVGRITIKRLTDSGYPLPYACALVASGACTGILIPPSIAYIIIGLVLGISASTLFLAAMIPGVMIMISIMLTNIVMNRIKKFELQIKNDGGWKTIHKGTTIGSDFTLTIEPVTTQHVRLNILEATDVPTIYEVELFNE